MVCCVYVWALDVVFSVQNKMERTTTKRCKHIAVRTCIYPYNMKVVNIMRCNMSCRIISPQQTIGIPLFYFISCGSTIHRLLAAQLDGPTMPQEKERYRQCFYGCFWVNRIYIITYTALSRLLVGRRTAMICRTCIYLEQPFTPYVIPPRRLQQ